MARSSLGPIPAGNRYAPHRYSPGKAYAIQVAQFALPPHATPMRHRVKHIARSPSSPPADHCLASDGHSSQTTESLENLMSFLQQSDLKKHLSTRSGNMSTHHSEAVPAGGSRVILRDGNLITLPPPTLGERVVETPKINMAKT
jgi:hypothetical protein